MNTALIKSRFARSLGSYNKNAKVQYKMANKLVSYFSNQKYGNVLELGCGTGFLTNATVDKIKYNTYDAIDLVGKSKEFINKIDSSINFIESDILAFLNNQNGTYDLIVSNATLQWFENFDEIIERLVYLLNPNGELVVSTFGIENFREITMSMGVSLKYYSVSEIKNLLKMYNMQIEEEIYVLKFDTPLDVLKHLKSTGVNSIQETYWTKKDLKEFENSYMNFCNNRATLTYNPIYISIRK